MCAKSDLTKTIIVTFFTLQWNLHHFLQYQCLSMKCSQYFEISFLFSDIDLCIVEISFLRSRNFFEQNSLTTVM